MPCVLVVGNCGEWATKFVAYFYEVISGNGGKLCLITDIEAGADIEVETAKKLAVATHIVGLLCVDSAHYVLDILYKWHKDKVFVIIRCDYVAMFVLLELNKHNAAILPTLSKLPLSESTTSAAKPLHLIEPQLLKLLNVPRNKEKYRHIALLKRL